MQQKIENNQISFSWHCDDFLKQIFVRNTTNKVSVYSHISLSTGSSWRNQNGQLSQKAEPICCFFSILWEKFNQIALDMKFLYIDKTTIWSFDIIKINENYQKLVYFDGKNSSIIRKSVKY